MEARTHLCYNFVMILKEFNSFLALVTAGHLAVVLGVVLIYAAVMSWVLLYHWQEYGLTRSKIILATEATYLSVIAILIATMAIFFYLVYFSS